MDYFLLRPNGEQTGTFSLYQVKMMQKTGFIGPETRFWMEGMTDWVPVTRIEEFINFVPPPSSSRRGEPPLHTWSGSLARAIPSPHQKQLTTKSGAIPKMSKVEIPVAEKKPSIPEVPPANHHESPVQNPVVPTEVSQPVPVPEPEPAYSPVEQRAKPARLIGYLLVSICLLVLAAVVLYASRTGQKKSDPLAEVTFPGLNVYALLDQATIKPFQDDLSQSPVIDDLRLRISQTEDPATLQKLQVALDKENTRHPDEIRQQYLQGGKAQFIEGGKYRVVGYFDDNGTLIAPKEGEAWVAISYKDSIVFAHKEPVAAP